MPLNEKQKLAALCGDGPNLVIAGPGTGKTATLTERVVHLLKDRGVASPQVMVLTFTRKAADEMRERIRKAAHGYHVDRLQIGTFHSVALALLKMIEEQRADIPKKKILNDGDRFRLCDEAGLRFKAKTDETVLEVIDRAKERMQTPEQFAKWVESQNYADGHHMREAPELYRQYEAILTSRGLRDFNDIILELVRYMREHPPVAASFSKFYEQVLVDEFQDCNVAQLEMLRLMTHVHQNIWAVGDDDQSLYGFRGANSEFILNFDRYFPGAKIFTLTTNYRCPKPVIEVSNSLIANNQMRHDKELVAASSNAELVRLISVEDEVEEARRIANAVNMLIHRGYKPNDNAILVRTGRLALPILTALSAARIPFHFSRDIRMDQMQPYRELVKILKALEAGKPEGLPAKPPSKREKTLLWIAERVRSVPIEDRYKEVCAVLRVNPPDNGKKPVSDDWFKTMDLLAEVPARTSAELEKRFKPSDPDDSVAVMPIHSSKGLEWQNVFVAGVDSTQMPHPLNEDVEEERRVLYVAATRAQNMLCISYPRERASRTVGPSIFIRDAFENVSPNTSYFDGPGNESPLRYFLDHNNRLMQERRQASVAPSLQ